MNASQMGNVKELAGDAVLARECFYIKQLPKLTSKKQN